VATLNSTEKPEGRVMLPKEALEYLRGVAVAGWNPVFSGATSSAKTTMLNACLRLWPRHWRTVTVETSVAELRLEQVNWVPLFSNEEFRGSGEPNELSQEGILRAAMRLSPKPIPTGEVRGSDGALWAHLVSTGHEASPVTLHAGSTDEALMRLVQMILAGPDAGQLTEASAKIKAALAANVVFQLARDEAVIDGKVVSIRRCTSITEVQTQGSFMEGSFGIKLVQIFETQRDARGEPRLVYVGKDHCQLWRRLRARYQDHLIPEWAKSDGLQ
jgi:type IV secretory pathway ATPase VirB11/archaellum biosynthesis ATPase